MFSDTTPSSSVFVNPSALVRHPSMRLLLSLQVQEGPPSLGTSPSGPAHLPVQLDCKQGALKT
ncbi:hypothetical protein BDR04DRAFT_1102929 [Suillus decipiens]|nr:hypothetical protein BDR04DRAFT_1102929 [Suillus decipiens]